MRKLWLLFAQTTTVALAFVFAIGALKPELFDRHRATIVSTREAGPPASAPSSETTMTMSFRRAAQKALPAVVHIFTRKEIRRHPLMDDPIFRRFFEDVPDESRTGLGTGVIVSPEGYILTNFHVVEAADEIEIQTADDRKLKARVVGTDPETDLAVLKIEAERLPSITLGQMESVSIGDVVLAIGNPFGVGQTVTMGIVSALGRTHLGINTFENFIQTDAAINPGNSGGALIDVNGNLVGINTAIYSRTGGSLGIGFAIPVSTAQKIMEEIIQHGKVTRGWIGIEAQEISLELAESFGLPNTNGALIAGVVRGSPADQSGILPGDVLLSINQQDIRDTREMLEIIAALKPGDEADFRLRRARNVHALKLKIGQRPAQQRRRRVE
jgi:Do/DeqQ family serine protease